MVRYFKDGRVRFECRTSRFSNKYRCKEHCEIMYLKLKEFHCNKGVATMGWIDFLLHGNKVKRY